jgi:hypothetical protein
MSGRLELAGSGHLRLRQRSGRSVVMAAPPSDWRAGRNLRAFLRRTVQRGAA